jgi:HAD superfamily hydrolase (TIGR01509 family)
MMREHFAALDAVVFDMDGVLLDSEPLHYRALNRVLAAEGHHIDAAAYVRFVGTTTEFTWAELVRDLALAQPPERYYRRYDDAILEVLRAGRLRPLPGVRALMRALRRRGKPIGLATQSHPSWVAATLDGLGMQSTFDAVVTREDVSRGKPAPDLYLRACALLGAAPCRSLALEDSLPGVRSARAAGMLVVGLRSAYSDAQLDAEAHLVVARADNLLDPSLPWPQWPRRDVCSQHTQGG